MGGCTLSFQKSGDQRFSPSPCSPPEKKVIATREEQDNLTQVSLMIEDLVVRKIENFRSHFPFGCPKDDLKVTFKLFNLVGLPI